MIKQPIFPKGEDTIPSNPEVKKHDEKNVRGKHTKDNEVNLGFRSDMFVVPRIHSFHHGSLPFSELMRSMAKKYQSTDLNQQL